MSESHFENRSSSESQPELKQLVHQLRSIEMPKSNISVEKLMYQAGWQAALANRLKEAKAAPSGNSVSPIWRTMAVLSSLASMVLMSIFVTGWPTASQDSNRMTQGRSHDEVGSSDTKSSLSESMMASNEKSAETERQTHADIRSWRLAKLLQMDEPTSEWMRLSLAGYSIVPSRSDLARIDSSPVSTTPDSEPPLQIRTFRNGRWSW